MVDACASIPPTHLLRRRFRYRNTILRGGDAQAGTVVSELGVFGACLSDTVNNEIVANDTLGTLLRTKLSHVLDGGVASGRAVLDSPLAL